MNLLFVLLTLGQGMYAQAQPADTAKVRIPLNRQLFHDRIRDEQRRADLMDGKMDTLLYLSNRTFINRRASDAIFHQVDILADKIETDPRIPGNNEKIKYLKYLQEMIQDFENTWRKHLFNPDLTPTLVRGFGRVMDVDIDGGSMEDIVQQLPYEVGSILVSIFTDNKGRSVADKELYLKYCAVDTRRILESIDRYKDEPFVDSLISVVAVKRPAQLYDYAQATRSLTSQLIRNDPDPKVQNIVRMADTKDGQLLFPFLDDILTGKQKIDDIEKAIPSDLDYYQLLVNTEIAYAGRMARADTPMGTRGLTDMLQKKVLDIYVSEINELHESPDPVRFKVIEPLRPEDLYYLAVLGEEDIFTSSYVWVYKRIMQLVPSHQGDSLLLSVNFDKFKKFIKMAASYNTLANFLGSMSERHSMQLMAAFVRDLDRTPDLEDAVDVANSYASINDKGLRHFLESEVDRSDDSARAEDNKRKLAIYDILRTIFASTDSASGIDLTKVLGIPPIYSVNYKSLTDDSGRVVEQVFFYGDKDGLQSYADFMGLFNNRSQWRVTHNREWVTIKSLKGRPIWIYANLPLDNTKDLDDQAQVDLIAYLDRENLHPSVVIHRGHSYHLKYTIKYMPSSAKIIILGSCGGYKSLNDVLSISPDAHIISSKQTGTQTVNEPIIRAINDELLAGKNIEWLSLWARLAREFRGDPTLMDRFSDYIPPDKNLGALFIKAYKIKMGDDEN